MDASKIPNSLEKPDVFASEATKRGAVWTKAMCDWVIATAHSNNDKADIKAFLDAANGIVDESTYKYVMATYNSVNGRKEDLPGKIRDVDFITPIPLCYYKFTITKSNNIISSFCIRYSFWFCPCYSVSRYTKITTIRNYNKFSITISNIFHHY